MSSLYNPSGIFCALSNRISCTFLSRTVGTFRGGWSGVPSPVSSWRRRCMSTTCAYTPARHSDWSCCCLSLICRWRSLSSWRRRAASSRHPRLYSSRRCVASTAVHGQLRRSCPGCRHMPQRVGLMLRRVLRGSKFIFVGGCPVGLCTHLFATGARHS